MMYKRFAKIAFVLVMLVTIMAFFGCNKDVRGKNVGAGNIEFTFEVTDADKNVTSFTIHTDEKTVGAALLKEGLIMGEESTYGLLVKFVNGIEADYDKNKAYWAFYIDGEYAMTGVDSTDIEKDKVYAFVYTQD